MSKSRVKKGKWTNELQQTESLLAKHYEDLLFDVSAFQGKTPDQVLTEFTTKLNKLKEDIIKNSERRSFFDPRLIKIRENIAKLETIKTALENLFAPKLHEAKTTAAKFSQEHKETIGRVTKHFEEKLKGGARAQDRKRGSLRVEDSFMGTERSIHFQKDKPQSIYEHSVNPHVKTWSTIRPKLKELAQKLELKQYENNSLAFLLIPDDKEFLKEFEQGNFTGEEIGFLAVQRLREIAGSPISKEITKEMKGKANELILSVSSSSEWYKYNSEALDKEIIKLVLHSLLHPNSKIVWLGSARPVSAMIKSTKLDAKGDRKEERKAGEGIYLNCDDSEWSWELNRAWLQTAAIMGFEFRLVEQHFPEIEKAILSGESANLLQQLAKEIRSDTTPTQYSGKTSPTATPQEILALMDMGCVGRKNPDGSLSLALPKKSFDDEKAYISKSGVSLKRSHSAPNLFRSAPPPKYADRKKHFEEPTPSPITRKRQIT